MDFFPETHLDFRCRCFGITSGIQGMPVHQTRVNGGGKGGNMINGHFRWRSGPGSRRIQADILAFDRRQDGFPAFAGYLKKPYQN